MKMFYLVGSGKTTSGEQFSDEMLHDTMEQCLFVAAAMIRDEHNEYEYVSLWITDENGKTVKEF